MNTANQTPRDLSPNERLEYDEIGKWCRHDDDMIYKAAAVFLVISFGALPVAVQYPRGRYALFFVSLAIYIFWWLTAKRMSWFSSVRLQRARELEAAAGMQHHARLASPPSEQSSELGCRLSVRRLRTVFFGVLVIAWIVLLCILHGQQ